MQINLINELKVFTKTTVEITEQPSYDFKRQQAEYEPIRWACAGGHDVVVKYLLDECNLPIDICDETGSTPLIVASSAGHGDIVLDLLIRHANTNQRTVTGKTALHYAAAENRFQIVDMLLSYEAEINVSETVTLSTPLHEAAAKGNLEIVRLLLDNKCRLDMKDAEGNTPLHLACEEERAEVAELLIHSGFSITIRNNMNKTPCDLLPPYLTQRILGITER